MSREKAGYPLIGYFASNNAYASGLKTPKDLAGKRIAVTQTGSSFIIRWDCSPTNTGSS